MKKLLLTLGIISCTLANTLAQGTIAFGNSALTRVQIALPGSPARNATAADRLSISVWYGPAGSTRDQLVMAPGVATIGSDAGVMINAPSVFALPGTSPNEVVSLQIRAESPNNFCAETKVAQVTLGQTAGPGAVIWQTASGTVQSRLTPLIFNCPEPSTIVLGGLAGVFLLLRVRKSYNSN